MSQLYAIVAGAGPGTGAAIARRFAKNYTVILMARSTASYMPLEKEINESDGKAIGIATDVSSVDSIKSAFSAIDEQLGENSICAVCAQVLSQPGRPYTATIEDMRTSVLMVPAALARVHS